MAFTESQKLEVKRKAHFKCCVCEDLGFLHIHHIIPQEDGGPDTEDNAAPLCTCCHDIYGANPEKRKWIKEKRDFWYDFCERRLYSEDINKLEELNKSIEKMHSDQEERLKTVEQENKKLQRDVLDQTQKIQELLSRIPNTPNERKPEIFSQISSTANTLRDTATLMTKLGEGLYANPSCPKCGSRIGLYVSNQLGPPSCPNCGSPMK